MTSVPVPPVGPCGTESQCVLTCLPGKNEDQILDSQSHTVDPLLSQHRRQRLSLGSKLASKTSPNSKPRARGETLPQSRSWRVSEKDTQHHPHIQAQVHTSERTNTDVCIPHYSLLKTKQKLRMTRQNRVAESVPRGTRASQDGERQ